MVCFLAAVGAVTLGLLMMLGIVYLCDLIER